MVEIDDFVVDAVQVFSEEDKYDDPIEKIKFFPFLDLLCDMSDRKTVSEVIDLIVETKGFERSLGKLITKKVVSPVQLRDHYHKKFSKDIEFPFPIKEKRFAGLARKICAMAATRISSYIFNTYSRARNCFVRRLEDSDIKNIVNYF